MSKNISVLLVIVFSSLMITTKAAEGHYPVSIIELIVIPEKYLGKTIRVKGYFEFGTSSMIYLNQTSAEIGDTPSAVSVIDETKDGSLIKSCNKKYVVVSGRFIKFRNRFEISDVTKVLDLEKMEACWEKRK